MTKNINSDKNSGEYILKTRTYIHKKNAIGSSLSIAQAYSTPTLYGTSSVFKYLSCLTFYINFDHLFY
jgi:hypothetical protein